MSRIAEPPAGELSTATVARKRRLKKLRLVLIFAVLPALLLAAYTWITLHVTYASGERTGYVQKLSRKGWICKTWEGELAMMPVPGTVPQLFHFTVPETTTAQQIQAVAGQRVALSYNQHKGVPSSCFGETEYFVNGVRTVGP
jgi:hypothetical protein